VQPTHNAMVTEGCLPSWAREEAYNNGEVCKYGVRLPFDVTWNDEVSEEHPVLHFLAVCWSYVPIVVIALAVVRLLWNRGTREWQFLAFLGALTCANELAVKPLVSQQRPEGSCNMSCGMPSGHSAFSIGSLVLALLDAWQRVRPMTRAETASCGPRCAASAWNLFPFVATSRISRPQFLCMAATSCVLLGPVPVSRVILKDHSVEQVIVGAAVGSLVAVVWHLVLRSLVRRFRPSDPPWRWPGSTRLYVIRHDYGVPTLEELLQEACQKGPAPGPKLPAATEKSADGPFLSVVPCDEEKPAATAEVQLAIVAASRTTVVPVTGRDLEPRLGARGSPAGPTPRGIDSPSPAKGTLQRWWANFCMSWYPAQCLGTPPGT